MQMTDDLHVKQANWLIELLLGEEFKTEKKTHTYIGTYKYERNSQAKVSE